MGVLNGKEPVVILSGRFLLFEMVIALFVLLFYGPGSLWTFPTIGDEVDSHQTWNFDTDQTGTLPRNFVVGTLGGGSSAREWTVIDMQQSLVVALLKEAFKDYYGNIEDDTVIKTTGAADKPMELIPR